MDQNNYILHKFFFKMIYIILIINTAPALQIPD